MSSKVTANHQAHNANSSALSASTHIVLVRHGHVEGIDPPRFRGQIDLPLTDLGSQQAELTRDFVAHMPNPTAAYTSPLSRCKRTAEIMGQPTGGEQSR
jgi:broad specificity phosphatase PhoE